MVNAVKIYSAEDNGYNEIIMDSLRKNDGLKYDTGEILYYDGVKYLKEDIVNEIDELISETTLEKDMILMRGVDFEPFKDLNISILILMTQD